VGEAAWGTHAGHDAARGARWSACSARGAWRERNADAWAVHEAPHDRLGFAVADGVSSVEGSWAVAAAVARAAADWGANAPDVDLADPRMLVALANVAARQARAESAQGGATTLVVAARLPDGWVLAAVGDSALLLVAPAGPASPLTPLDQHPRSRHVLLAWIDGDARPAPHVVRLTATASRLCLLTDGVAGVLDADAIARIVRAAGTAAAAGALVAAAQAAGASDDATALVLDL
jgi:serine/threonine protein phosphatase PrpC